MPRGVRKSPEAIAEKVAEIDAKIKAHKNKIKTLTEKKKKLASTKEKSELSTLYEYMKETGKSPAEIISELPK